MTRVEIIHFIDLMTPVHHNDYTPHTTANKINRLIPRKRSRFRNK